MAIDYRITYLTREMDPMFPPDRPIDPALSFLYRTDLDSTNIPKKVSGIEKLCQRIIMVMLGTPGTDIWDMSKGGGLQRLSRMSWSLQGRELRVQAALVIQRTHQQILGEQRILDLPPAEKLVSLTLSRIHIGDRIIEPLTIDFDNLACFIRPTVESLAGDKAILTLSTDLKKDLNIAPY